MRILLTTLKWAFKIVGVGLGLLIFGLAALYFLIPEQPAQKTEFGITFSQIQAKNLSLDWRKTYLAILNDLKTRNLRLAAYWSEVEPEKDKFIWDDLDWMIDEAKKRNAEIILNIGRKQFRWPECYIPEWAKNLEIKNQRKEVLKLLEVTVKKYQGEKAIWAWQVENEPLFSFGICPERNAKFLDEEIALVRSLDSRPIIITDSGEFSLWIAAGSRADIFGTTMYRIVKNRAIPGFLSYEWIPAKFYRKKASFIKWLFPRLQDIIVVELQGEPWIIGKPLQEASLEEQFKTMDFGRFKRTVDYAKNVGYSKTYIWGAEWHYWLKEKQGHPEFWEYAKGLF